MRQHLVGALAGFSIDHVAGIVDEVGVVAGAAVMVSAPAPPSSRLLPVLPMIVLARALPVPLRSAPPVQLRFSTFAAEREVDVREHRVGALAGDLDHLVAGIVDEIGVVAGTAAHRVGAAAAVDAGCCRRCRRSCWRGRCRSPAGRRCPAAIRFSTLRRQAVADRALKTVSVPAPAFSIDGVAGIVDEIGVVAGAAAHDVGAGAAVEDVVAAIADDCWQAPLPLRWKSAPLAASGSPRTPSADQVTEAEDHIVAWPTLSMTLSPALSTK